MKLSEQDYESRIADLKHEKVEQAEMLVKASTRIEELETAIEAVRDKYEEELENTPQRIHEVLRDFVGPDLIEPWATTSTEWQRDLERAIEG